MMRDNAQDTAADRHFALGTMLAFAVPLWMDELHRIPDVYRDQVVQDWADQAVDVAACEGDVLMYGDRKGDAARAFNHVARGIAALAYAPGGVLYAGQHWCVEHPFGLRCASVLDLPCGMRAVEAAGASPC